MLYNTQKVLYYILMENSLERIPDGEYGERGYLKEKFRVFSIKDQRDESFDFHYHAFDKIVLFVSGNVTYIVEGKEYALKPYDILLVRHGDIHKPVISPNQVYERIIIWLDSGYLKENGSLSDCFDLAAQKGLCLLRAQSAVRSRIFLLAKELSAERDDSFGSELMRQSLLFQLMVLVNRVSAEDGGEVDFVSDEMVDSVLSYINKNLFKELSVDKISSEFYISRYHLMHRFKAATGKTVLAYIRSKRLLHAAFLLGKENSAKKVCFAVGFRDYSVFLKAFKKEFGVSPTEYKNGLGDH